MSQGPTDNRNVIVIGAGIGGVATAARLAKAGFKVTVVEKNEFVGGRCSLLHHDGHRFDQGPSLLLLPGLFEETFHDLGTSLHSEGIRLHKCDPNYHIHFHDGHAFTLSSDLATMKRELEAYEGKAGFRQYLAFLQESHDHYEASVVHVLHRTFESYLSMLRWGFLRNLLRLHPFESIWTRASKYFGTERLRRVFTFGSMYMGMSPYEAPGTYSLLQYTELAEGIWYPEGGFNVIPQKLAEIGRRLGVEYRLGTSVTSIDTDDSGIHTIGVTLDDGTKLHAPTIVANPDLTYTYSSLLPPSSTTTSLKSRPTSCSSLSFYWALDTTIPDLKTHNIFLAEHYRESFDQIFHDQGLPTEPSFYVNVPSRVDPTAAPAGKDTVAVLCPVGHLIDEDKAANGFLSIGAKKGLNPRTQQEWNDLVDRARDAILDTMETRLNVKIREHITHETLNTPHTWRDKFNLDKGAILGLSHSFFNVLCFRPATKHASIKGLHFVGASTHPGTGVPIVLAGARLVADQVCEGLNVEKPWGEWSGENYERWGRPWAEGPGQGKEMDGGTERREGNGTLNGSANGAVSGAVKSRSRMLGEMDQMRDANVSWMHVMAAILAFLVALWFKRSGSV
ncbi:MAG: hypothetical protein Q9162_004446 [Coniocarpon cinnabarinum]